MIFRSLAIGLTIFGLETLSFATDEANPLDSLAPKTQKGAALALPLSTVTLSTQSMDQIRLFYGDGMGMTLTGPIEVSEQDAAAQKQMWGIADDIIYDEYHLTRPGAEIAGRGAMKIRVLDIKTPVPSVHQSWDPRSLGGFTIGFPTLDQDALDAKIRDLGFGALNEIEKYKVPRTDGTLYDIHETIFNGPDFVHAVGINRVDMSPLGAIDAETKLGGPGYSAQVVANSDHVLAFYTDVLGLELRRDMTWKSAGKDGAMALPNGTEFRFALVFAKGFGPGGHMLFLDFLNIDPITSGVPPRLPNLGIGMWSFPVTDLAQVLENAESFGSEIVAGATAVNSPLFGPVTAATLLAPNGLLIELYETRD